MSLPDPRAEATAYLTSRSVLPLFNSLGTKLMYAKPSDPNAFLLSELKALQSLAGKQGGASASKTSAPSSSDAPPPCLPGTGSTSFFTVSDVSTMFGMLDPTNSGYVTAAQYAAALASFGVVGGQTVDVAGASGKEGKIGREAFEKAVWAELKKV